MAVVIYAAGGLDLPGRVEPVWLAAGFALFLASTVALTHAWWIYLGDDRGERPPWLSVYRASQAANLSSLVLPSPAPSLTRPIFLAGDCPPDEVLGSTVLERVNVILVYGLATGAAGVLLVGHHPSASVLSGVLAVAVVWIAVWVFGHWALSRRRSRTSAPSWLARIGEWIEGLPGVPGDLLTESMEDAGARAGQRWRTVRAVPYQVAGLVVLEGLVALAVGHGLNVGAPSWALFLLPLAANAMTVLPVLPRGLGAVEGAGVALLGAVGVPGDQGLAFMLAYRGLLTAGIILVGGLAASASGVRWVETVLDTGETAT